MTRNGKQWQLTIDVPRSGRQIADALSEYGSVDAEAGFKLLTEVSATTFGIHSYGSGSDPSKRKFPGILNVILDLVARCHLGKFGFYPLNFVSPKMWNFGQEWWKIGFRPWESFPLEMWNFEMGWFDEKFDWSPFLIWICLGTIMLARSCELNCRLCRAFTHCGQYEAFWQASESFRPDCFQASNLQYLQNSLGWCWRWVPSAYQELEEWFNDMRQERSLSPTFLVWVLPSILKVFVATGLKRA